MDHLYVCLYIFFMVFRQKKIKWNENNENELRPMRQLKLITEWDTKEPEPFNPRAVFFLGWVSFECSKFLFRNWWRHKSFQCNDNSQNQECIGKYWSDAAKKGKTKWPLLCCCHGNNFASESISCLTDVLQFLSFNPNELVRRRRTVSALRAFEEVLSGYIHIQS